MSNSKNILFSALAAAMIIGLAACSNTVDGAGRDIERAGEKIQQTF